MADSRTVSSQLASAVHQNRALSRAGALERLFAQSFKGLVYPQIWEDPVIDMEALEIGPEDHLVCIASGSCNVMSYLTAGPRAITAVDLSPAHVALGKLKIAAARHLPGHAEFYDLFGRADVKGNKALVASLLPHLDEPTRAYWTSRWGLTCQRADMFERGFYREGLLGDFIGWAHRISRLLGVRYDRFLASRTLEEQKSFFDTQVAPLFDARIVRFLGRQRAALFGLGIPPAQYDKLAEAGDGDIIAALRERTRALMCDHPVSENYFAWQAYNRGYKRDGTGPLPPYLQADEFETVRANADRVEVLNRSLTEHLKDLPANSRQGYVLLDAQDWMTDEQLNALWTQITRTAAPGARVIFRTAGIPSILPGRVAEQTLGRWTYHAERSREMTRRDRSAIYGGFHLYTFDG